MTYGKVCRVLKGFKLNQAQRRNIAIKSNAMVAAGNGCSDTGEFEMQVSCLCRLIDAGPRLAR
ncbi:hypothetical protein AVXHC19_14050 [Acidovorax sacchari]